MHAPTLSKFLLQGALVFAASLACAQTGSTSNPAGGMRDVASEKTIVVDGELWLRSSPETRKAFLVGAGNMMALETAYSRKKGTPPPVAGAMAGKALDGLTLDQISSRVTRWYEGNPGRRNMPVMGVIWVDMVDAGAGRK
jgi:hypothetical protein